MQAGDKIKISTKKRLGWESKECIYISETDKTILINTGNYPTSINKVDIKCGNVKIEPIGDEDMNDNKGPKITKEQLLEECRALGTNKEAREAIAKKYGLTEGTVQNYIYRRWPIMDELNASRENQEDKSEEHQNQQSKLEEEINNGVVDDEEEKNAEKIIKTIKESQNHIVKQDSLEVLSMTLRGKNGIYKVCENGIELNSGNGLVIFTAPEDVDEFAAECKAVFAKINR